VFQYNNKSLFSGSSEIIKIVLLALFLLLAFLIQNAVQQAFFFIGLFFLLAISRYKNFFSLFFGILPFLLLADFGIWFFLQDSAIDWLNLIVVSNIRIYNLLMSAVFFSFSTDAFALVRLFRSFRMPEIIALPVFVLFRFLPEIERDFLEIRGIQKMRGISPKKPLYFAKSLLIPLFITVLQKADELAIAYYLRKKSGRDF